MEIIEQLFLRLVDALELVAQLVADAGFDHHRGVASAYQQRIATHGDQVALIGLHLALPQCLRDNTEEGAAIGYVGTVRDCGELKVAERDTLVLHCDASARDESAGSDGCRSSRRK